MLFYRLITRHEKWLFYLILLFNIIPLFAGKIFVTLDGAAHGYNVNIMRDLLFNGGETYGNYFKMNYELVPNLFGHVFSLIMTSFLPYYIVEKILVLSFLIFVPILYRKIVLFYQPENSSASFLIFPFTHYSLLYLGFYNFSMAIVFMLACILYWLNNKQQLTFKKYLAIFGFFILIYFSHIFVFATTLLFIGLDFVTKETNTFFTSKDNRSEALKRSSITAGVLTIIALPFLVLMYNYFKARPGLGKDIFLSGPQIFEMFRDVSHLAIFRSDLSSKSTWFFYSLLVLLVFLIIYRIKTRQFISPHLDTWLFLSLALIGLLLKFPDNDGYASFISIRFVILFYITFLIWLSIQKVRPFWYFFIALAFCYPYLTLRKENRHAERWFRTQVDKVTEAVTKIGENRTLLPVDLSGNWLAGHFSNYLATDKNIVILENYEAFMGYFPVLWNDAKMPQLMLSDSLKLPCVRLPEGNANLPRVKPDYVLVWGEPKDDKCYLSLKTYLETHYTQAYSKEDVVLYKKL